MHGAARRRRPVVIDNLLVRIHFIIVMIRWTGLVLNSVFQVLMCMALHGDPWSLNLEPCTPNPEP